MTPTPLPWLFSARADVLAFGGSAALSLLFVVVGGALGLLDGEAPEWTWIACVLLVDVAHVWGNLLLIYTDGAELRRRPVLYASIPLIGLAIGAALASESELWLWRALAYLAVIHFVRQQVGWVKLYRARARELQRGPGMWLDLATIYVVTIAPVIVWHTRLPDVPFAWLAPNDFVSGAPTWLGDVALVIEVALLALYGARAVTLWRSGRGNPGKDLVVVTSALLWWLGIVALRSDYAFTVTNVLIHGIPYVVLIAWTARARQRAGASLARPLAYGVVVIVAALWTCALVEEVLWDRLVWHERPWLSWLPAIDSDALRPYVIAMLALPQLTHYVLDGFLWRRKDNAELARQVES